MLCIRRHGGCYLENVFLQFIAMQNEKFFHKYEVNILIK